MSLPISLTVQSLVPAMLAKPGLRSQFHLMIQVVMGKIEGAISAATDYDLLLDTSGSMGKHLGTSTRLDVVKAACEQAINLMGPDDRVGITIFHDYAEDALPLTQCNHRGKIDAINAVYGVNLGASTIYASGLEASQKKLRGSERKRAVIFFTDGENTGGDDPIPIAASIREAGISLFVGGLGVANQYEQLLEAIAGVSTNFKPLADVADVEKFFAGAQQQAASAVVTNAHLRVLPVTFANVSNFELVDRQGKVNYVPAANNTIPIGEVGEGDNYRSYLGLNVVLPEDIKTGRRSFGKIELVGDVVSQGLKGQVLGATPIAVMFSDQMVATVNEVVKSMINTAATARELYKAGQASSASEAAAHVANARKTAAFTANDDVVAQALKAQIADIESKMASDPNAAQKQAKRATRGFDPNDPAVLAAMRAAASQS